MQAQIKKLFSYNTTTGILRQKVRTSKRVKIGDVIGNKRKDGYIRTEINGKGYLAHRLVWVLHNGDIPNGMQIDHINGVRDDNRIENLRLATRSINCQNLRHARTDNKSSGLLGVYKRVYKHRDKYEAKIRIDGKSIYLGLFLTPESAHAAYLQAKRELHSGCTI